MQDASACGPPAGIVPSVSALGLQTVTKHQPWVARVLQQGDQGLARWQAEPIATTMKINLSSLTLLLALAALTPVAVAQEKDTKAPAAEEKVAPDTITSVLRDGATFSILTKALKAAELDEMLGAKGSFTIFAPTDEAFGKLPEGTLDRLLLPENKEKLRSLLLYHVIPGNFLAADLKNGEIKTANGEKVEIDLKSDTKQVEDSNIAKADLVVGNGVVHSIDKVMVPESLDGFAKLDED
jgi:uncharacterized surface protein with fasciclin (FAS1) repeats